MFATREEIIINLHLKTHKEMAEEKNVFDFRRCETSKKRIVENVSFVQWSTLETPPIIA